MKISTEQIVALQESIARRKTQGPEAGDFANLLQQTLDPRQAQGVASADQMQNLSATGLAHGLEQLIGTTVSNVKASGSEGFAVELDAILSTVEQYAANMASGNKADMRLAHSQLESMSNTLAALKNALPDMEEQDPALMGVFNELDAMATTERFKFNRGDYL